jgi:hypothetical protein
MHEVDHVFVCVRVCMWYIAQSAAIQLADKHDMKI